MNPNAQVPLFTGCELRDYLAGHAGFSSTFKYTVGTIVKPTKRFSRCFAQCESGIHFFLNIYDALCYVA